MFTQLGSGHTKAKLIVPFDPYIRTTKPSQPMYAALKTKGLCRIQPAGACYFSVKFAFLNHDHSSAVNKKRFIVGNHTKESLD
jgi:hypothetical protein